MGWLRAARLALPLLCVLAVAVVLAVQLVDRLERQGAAARTAGQ